MTDERYTGGTEFPTGGCRRGDVPARLRTTIVTAPRTFLRMTNSQRLATVRSHLLRWLAENVSPTDAEKPRIVSESILIRDGFYGGRSFQAVAGDDSFRAAWFMEPDELKIRNHRGEVVGVFQGDQIVASDEAEPVQDAPVEQPVPVEEPVPVEAESPERSSEDGGTDERPISLPMPQVAAAAEADEAASGPQTDVDSSDDAGEDQLPQAA